MLLERHASPHKPWSLIMHERSLGIQLNEGAYSGQSCMGSTEPSTTQVRSISGRMLPWLGLSSISELRTPAVRVDWNETCG